MNLKEYRFFNIPLYKLILLIIISLSIFFLLRELSPAQTIQLLQHYPSWAVLISISLNILISLAGILPSVFLTGANTLVFGLFLGGIISWLGEILGALISFFFYRYFLRPTQTAESSYEKLNSLLPFETETASFRLILIARILPMIPSGLVNLVGALSPLTTIKFLTATALGKAPSLLLETFIGHDIFHWREYWPRLILLLLLTGIIYYIIKRKTYFKK